MNVTGLVHHLGQFLAPVSSSLNETCKKHSQEYIDGISRRLPWALAMADATAKPQAGLLEGNVNSLGYFDECVNVNSYSNFSAQHCIANIIPNEIPTTVMEEMLKLKGLSWGICLPKSCSSFEIKTSLDEWLADWNVMTDTVNCDDSLSQPMNTADYVAIFILTILVLLVLLSTGYDWYLNYTRQETDNVNNEHNMKHHLGLSFSAIRNCRYLCMKAKDSDMSSLYGIRFLSICWIILGHVVLVMEAIPAVNYLHVVEMLGNWTIMFIVSAPLAVDTFLLLSGLLVAHKFLNGMPSGTSPKKLCLASGLIFIHRYLRIAPAVAVLILMQVSIWKHFGSGPLWLSTNGRLEEFCKENWGWTLLFIQNYVSANRMCLEHSWYLNVDTQLFVFSPLIIMPMLYWKELACLLLLIGVSLCGFFITFLVNYLYEFPPGLLVGDSDKWAARNQYYYMATHARFTPYVVGMTVGYLLHKYKNGEIVFLSLSQRNKILLWVAVILALLYSIFGVLPFQLPDYKYEPVGASIFIAIVPLVWALGVSWILIFCELNQSARISRLLGWKGFQPLARLTYCIYLVHPPIMTMQGNVKRLPIYLNTSDMIVDFCGKSVLSIFFGCILYLMVEAPFIKIGYLVSGFLNDRYLKIRKQEKPLDSMGMRDSPVLSPVQQPFPESATTSFEVTMHREGEEPHQEPTSEENS